MLGKMNKTKFRILASILAVLTFLNFVPMSGLVKAATPISNYKIALTDDQGKTLSTIDTCRVSIAETPDGESVETVKTVAGVATFNTELVEDTIYYVSVDVAIGYANVEDFEISPVDGVQGEIQLNEIPQIPLNGTIRDEDEEPYSGANVTIEGYGITTPSNITTDASGQYQFENLYQGQTYEVTVKPISSDDAKYENINFEISALEEGFYDKNFALKKYTISTTTDGNGTITQFEEQEEYGAKPAITAEANENYVIDTFKVDGNDIALANGQESYTYEDLIVEKAHTVEVTFKEVRKLIFTVGENGAVTANGDPVGMIETYDVGTNVQVAVTPDEGYRVAQVVIDGEIVDEYNVTNNGIYTQPFTMDESHTFVVTFEKNQYTVTTTDSGHGTSYFESEGTKNKVVNYGDNAILTIEPEEKYNASVQVDGVTVGGIELNSDGETYNFELSNLTEDKDIIVTYTLQEENEDVEYTLNSEIAIEDNTDDYVKYIYPCTAKATFAVVDTAIWGGFRITYEDGYEFVTGGAITFDKSVKITNIEMYSETDEKWYTVPDFKEIRIVIDTEAPVVDPDTTTPPWADAEVILKGTVTDSTDDGPSSGLSHIVWSAGEEMSVDDVRKVTSGEQYVAIDDGKYSFKITGEQNKVYYIYGVDKAGNISGAAEVTVMIDETAPEIETINFEKLANETNPLIKVFHFLTFGFFYNDDVTVNVTASDENGAGVKYITLYIGEDDEICGKKAVDENNSASFVVPRDELLVNGVFTDTLRVTATDNVDNTSEAYEPNDINANIPKEFMLETVKPTATAVFATPADDMNSATVDGNLWYATDVAFDVMVKDQDSGIRSVKASINSSPVAIKKFTGTSVAVSACAVTPCCVEAEELILQEAYYFTNEQQKELNFVINTNQVKANKDGSYKVVVDVCDNAGNTCQYVETVYVDTEVPTVDNFNFSVENYKEGASSPVDATDYGFYFKENTKVTVEASDGAVSSGLKEIEFYTEDIEDGIKTLTSAAVDASGKSTFTIEAGFKGKIYAKAVDNVGNIGEYVSPDGTIIEPASIHNKETHISFKKSAAVAKTNSGSELYAANVPVEITITDSYSGIRQVEWSVISPYNTMKNELNKVVSVDNAKNFSGDNGWSISKHEENLVTEMKKTIIVDNNSNDIVLWVKMTDRSGNVSEEQISFSIDKTTPVIEIAYDNNDADDTYTDIYKANRTATITVTERNFNAKDIVSKITNTDGVIPTISGWTEHKNTENPDETYYTATVAYVADGDYTFDISFKDLAKNAANIIAQHRFTLDKTLPTVTVAYDNNSAMNGNYYKADRTATITIQEHNFDANRVNILGTATDNGAVSVFPTISSWSTSGDTHVATIEYDVDSLYRFDIEYLDKAGNSIADYTPEEFYVDKTMPTLDITGVGDKSANSDVVAPVITYSDTNFDMNNVTFTLTGINNGQVQYEGSYADIANGQTYTFADFTREQKVDDIYTLTVTLTDKAGNQTQKAISFSVNRFGSVYDMSSVKDIIGKYLKAEQDIIFTETNVDALARGDIKVKLIKNGTAIDLIENQDYTLEITGGNGQWSVYKYIIKKALFTDDGKYSISVYSMDAAGNVNENIDESKVADISFGIDKTNPVIVPIDLESRKQYPVELKTVDVEIKDNLVLEKVTIYLNDKEVKYKENGETYTFEIPEMDAKQNVKIVACDAAGNEYEQEVKDFLVSTNLFVRWYNNTPLFIGSIVGVVVVACGITAFILFGRKKKNVKK